MRINRAGVGKVDDGLTLRGEGADRLPYRCTSLWAVTGQTYATGQSGTGSDDFLGDQPPHSPGNAGDTYAHQAATGAVRNMENRPSRIMAA